MSWRLSLNGVYTRSYDCDRMELPKKTREKNGCILSQTWYKWGSMGAGQIGKKISHFFCCFHSLIPPVDYLLFPYTCFCILQVFLVLTLLLKPAITLPPYPPPKKCTTLCKLHSILCNLLYIIKRFCKISQNFCFPPKIRRSQWKQSRAGWKRLKFAWFHRVTARFHIISACNARISLDFK